MSLFGNPSGGGSSLFGGGQAKATGLFGPPAKAGQPGEQKGLFGGGGDQAKGALFGGPAQSTGPATGFG